MEGKQQSRIDISGRSSDRRWGVLTLPSLRYVTVVPLWTRPVVLTLPLRSLSSVRAPTWLDTPINNEYMNMKISMRIRPPYIHGDGCSQCRDYISTHASYRSIARFDREHAAVLREFRVLYYWGRHFRIGGVRVAGIIWSTDIFIDRLELFRSRRIFFGIDVRREWFRRFGFNLTRWTDEYMYFSKSYTRLSFIC